MEPVRSSLGGGVAATVVLTAFLLVTDVLLGGSSLFVFATLTSLCSVGGPPYCAVGSSTAFVLTYAVFLALFVIAWPLLFGGFTWGLPGESGVVHGGVFGAMLWAGYAVTVVYGIGVWGVEYAGGIPLLVVTLLAYLVYGVVLGGVYDRLAEHRTFLSAESEPESESEPGTGV